MGVLRFFNYLSHRHTECLHKLVGVISACESASSKGIHTDWLELDLNSIFHPVAQELYQYGKVVPISLMHPKKSKPIPQAPEKVLFSEICKRIEDIRKIIQPTKGIYFAIDGVAGISKQCLVGDSMISLNNGLSKRLDEMVAGETVLGWNKTGFTATPNLGLQIKGEKNTLQITMYDGRTLILTPDHKILIKRDGKIEWEYAINLKNGDKIVSGLELPQDFSTVLETSWELKIGNDIFNMKTWENRERSLALARVIGFLLTDGYLENSETGMGVFSTEIDSNMFKNDIFKLARESPKICHFPENKGSVCQVHLPTKLVDILSGVKGITIGKRVIQSLSLPDFILDELCPISIIREFLGGLFGGDGYSPEMDNGISATIQFAQSIIEKYTDKMDTFMDDICKLLSRVGVGSFKSQKPWKHIYLEKNMQPDDALENPRFKHLIYTGDILEFGQTVGFRYATNKSLNLTIVMAYYRFCNNVKITTRYIPTPEEFLDITETTSWFSHNSISRAMNQDSIEIPYFVLPIADIRAHKKCQVYDIEVYDNHSFLANGLCVHNCQQRKRRFKSVMDSEKKTDVRPTIPSDNVSKFDSNCISTGTLFMERLGKYINEYIQRQLQSDPDWKDLEIIISDSRVEGEGEHKLLRHIRKNPQFSYTIVSPDADLIFLGMGVHNPRIYIFRENIFDDIEASFFLVDIARFRQCVLEEIKMQDEKDEEKIKSIIEDFIFYCMKIGNDFLPSIPSLNVSNDGIKILLDVYTKIVKEHGFITCKDENGNYNIRKEGLKAFLYEMAQVEYEMLVNNQKRNLIRYPDTLLLKHVSYPIVPGKLRPSGLPERALTINFETYREEYYKAKFHGVDIKTIVHEYLKGMLFVLRYYLQGIPSWQYCYPFNYAPYFVDMYAYIDDFDTNMVFPPSSPLSPLEQLVAILPGKNADLLPEPLRMLSVSSESPIIDFYPIEFEVDLEGKKNDYEGVILIPMVCPMRIRAAFQELESQLSEYDRVRNKPGLIFQYSRDKDGKVCQNILN